MKLAASLCCLAWAGVCAAEPARDTLAAGFAEPSAEARPLVFWQWVNGNVTHEGIRLDLEWMQRIGLGGTLLFDIGFRTPPVPQYVEKRVGFGTREWEAAVHFAAAESRRLGLEFGAQSSGGWSVSGGPMVAPEQAMKKLVWSETVVTPTTPSTLRLPPPPSTSGPYQDIPIDEPYREPIRSDDVAVIGYRLPDAEQSASPRPVLTGVADVSLLDDRLYAATSELIPDADGNASLLARFSSTAPRALTIAVRGALPPGVVEASADGVHYTHVIELPGRSAQAAPVQTFALPERTDTSWRIRFPGLTRPLAVAEARFDFGAHVNRAPEKAGYGVLADYAASETAPMPASFIVDARNVLDLSKHLSSDGMLSWRPREGTWIALRFGWSLTGRRTVPATAESIGLEVDKLDADAVRAFGNAFFGRYAQAIGDAGSLNIALVDSWEAGQQNWTPAMFREFATRRGYDLLPWMPVLTGRVVGDAGRSERFLADYRRTIADLLADNHYGVLAKVTRERGMSLYAEAAGTDLPTVIDGIQAKGRVDVPMGEYWFYPEDGAPKPNHIADIREAASAAHLYGRRIVAAEALTTMGEAAWTTGPAQLRRIVDRFFAEGVNRVVLHTSAHQPFTDRKPGITLRQYGQHFTRNETWAEDAGAWVQYLARTSWLLQQGRPVADVAVFIGEDAALSPPFGPGEPQGLSGYDHDFLNAEALLKYTRVRDGRLTRPDGASYRAVVIAPGVRRMSLQVIARLRSLVAHGGVLIGAKPLGAIGMAHDAKVRAIADEIWGGRGRVYADVNPEEALRAENVLPDVDVSAAAKLHWTHRTLPDADIYFLSNQSSRAFEGPVKFRVRGRHAERWDAVDGSRRPVTHSVGEQTTVQLELPPHASCFIVFRGNAPAGDFPATPIVRTALSTLDGPWDVQFLDGQGTPAATRFPSLASWTEHADPAIRYYSGRVNYVRTVAVPAAWHSGGKRLELDLGEVAGIARVRINDRDLGVLWNAPFRSDITDALRAGDNKLEVLVTNYWANRLIGDEQPGATRYTFAPIRPYTASSPLLRSGLSGPVRLMAAAATSNTAAVLPVAWNTAIVRKETAWYASAQARAIADSVLLYQSREGGWPKNTDLATPPRSAADVPSDGRENTFDNNGTTLPLEFLARVIQATPGSPPAYAAAFNRGLDYTLAAQYANGGWPQFYPLREGYYSHVTFNDDAMIRVMTLLRDIASGGAPYEFVDARRREKSAQAVKRGVELILRTQIRQEGALTVWCAQYDEHTLEPAWARKYEPPSLSGSESVGIVRFLMSVEKPTPAIVASVEGAVRWLRGSAIPGIRVEKFTNEAGEPDKRVVNDAGAEPLWARFYEPGTSRPIFLGRDSVYHYTFAEIERERRNGYNYYGTWARALLDRDYPAWKKGLR